MSDKNICKIINNLLLDNCNSVLEIITLENQITTYSFINNMMKINRKTYKMRIHGIFNNSYIDKIMNQIIKTNNIEIYINNKENDLYMKINEKSDIITIRGDILGLDLRLERYKEYCNKYIIIYKYVDNEEEIKDFLDKYKSMFYIYIEEKEMIVIKKRDYIIPIV